ncbi:MAG: SusD/RagB family nutrient-binding outer membrane lipoprotein [Bacteroidota bacterium]
MTIHTINQLFKKLFLLTFLIGLGMLQSCQNLFEEEDITQNPNAVNDVDVRTLLSGTLLGVANIHQDTDVRIASLWTRSINGLARAHQGYSQYIVSSTNFSWNQLYPIGGQARLIQQKAEELNEPRIKGIGQVLEALVIAKATALWGDVPYSQAFQPDEFPTPVYDPQLEVYTALQNTLDEAITNMDSPTKLNIAAQDFIFQGNIDKWIAAANTLKARLFLHQGNYVSAIEHAQLGIREEAGDMLVPHGNSQGIDTNQNYDFFAVTRAGDTGFDGAYMPELLRSRIGSKNTKTDETALFNHYITTGLTGQNSLDPNVLDGAFVADAPHPILTYHENQLILAEASVRIDFVDESIAALNTVRQSLSSGYINGLTMPEEGRRYEDYVRSDFEVGGLANPQDFTFIHEAITFEILAQRYIVLLMQYEAFNDYRRVRRSIVANPMVELPIPLSVGDRRPARFIYPQEQINTNPNTPSPLPDQFTTLPIFE